MFRLFDWPPVWLVASLALIWTMDRVLPWGVFGVAGQWCGALLAVGGLSAMLLAVAQMLAARTTVIPRQTPNALVTGGIFQITRNPIYLGDAMVLAGAVLWWDVPLALPLVALFMLVIQRRFILAEEAGLRIAFGPAFDTWAAKVRRWL